MSQTTSKNSTIFLIGFMGCGKTTLGKKLAQKLNYTFVDVDAEIERKEKRSIAEIFETSGEGTFREIESNVLQGISRENTVVSTGGGLPCFNNNMRFLNENGISVYLQRPAKELFHRLNKSKTVRPLLQNLQEDEMLTYIETTLNEREEFYQQAVITCDRDSQKPSEIVELIQAYRDRQKSL